MGYPSFNAGDVLTNGDMNAVGWWTLGSLTLNASAQTWDNIFTDNYSVYRIVGTMRASSNTNVAWMQLLNDSGTRLQSNYYSKIVGFDYGGSSVTVSQNDDTTTIRLGWVPNSTTLNLNFIVDLFDTRSSTIQTTCSGNHTGLSSGSAYLGGVLMSARTAAEKNRGIYITNSGSTTMSGTLRLYGYKD